MLVRLAPMVYLPKNLLDKVNQAKIDTLKSNSISTYLSSRKDKPSFFDDFLYYNIFLKESIQSFVENNIGLVNEDQKTLKRILGGIISKEIIPTEKIPLEFSPPSCLDNLYNLSFKEKLFENLFNCFLTLCRWKNEKTLTGGKVSDPGIYILYNMITGISYIGESKSIEMRFISHKLSLINGIHFNKGLLSSVNENGLESLLFLIIDYGPKYADKSFRREQKIRIINTWMGPVYNIKDVYSNHRYTKKYNLLI